MSQPDKVQPWLCTCLLVEFLGVAKHLLVHLPGLISCWASHTKLLHLLKLVHTEDPQCVPPMAAGFLSEACGVACISGEGPLRREYKGHNCWYTKHVRMWPKSDEQWKLASQQLGCIRSPSTSARKGPLNLMSRRCRSRQILLLLYSLLSMCVRQRRRSTSLHKEFARRRILSLSRHPPFLTTSTDVQVRESGNYEYWLPCVLRWGSAIDNKCFTTSKVSSRNIYLA